MFPTAMRYKKTYHLVMVALLLLCSVAWADCPGCDDNCCAQCPCFCSHVMLFDAFRINLAFDDHLYTVNIAPILPQLSLKDIFHPPKPLI